MRQCRLLFLTRAHRAGIRASTPRTPSRMNTTSWAVAAAACAAGASVAYAIACSSRRPPVKSNYDSSPDRSPSPPPSSSCSNAPLPLPLPLARDHDGGSPWLPVQPPANAAASRNVIKADALVWLKQQAVLPGSVVTSLPDVGEIKCSLEECVRHPAATLPPPPAPSSCPLSRYEPWFLSACELLFSKVAPGQFAMFYQTDIKMLEGAQVRARCDIFCRCLNARCVRTTAQCPMRRLLTTGAVAGAALDRQVFPRAAGCACVWLHAAVPQSRTLFPRVWRQKHQVWAAVVQPFAVLRP